MNILELQSIIIGRKNLHEFNGKFDMVGARTGEPTDRTVEIIENENQRGKRLKKNEQKNQRLIRQLSAYQRKGERRRKKAMKE